MAPAADVDDACGRVSCAGCHDARKDERSEEKGAEVIGAYLGSKPVDRDCVRCCHNGCAVDQDLPRKRGERKGAIT